MVAVCVHVCTRNLENFGQVFLSIMIKKWHFSTAHQHLLWIPVSSLHHCCPTPSINQVLETLLQPQQSNLAFHRHLLFISYVANSEFPVLFLAYSTGQVQWSDLAEPFCYTKFMTKIDTTIVSTRKIMNQRNHLISLMHAHTRCHQVVFPPAYLNALVTRPGCMVMYITETDRT